MWEAFALQKLLTFFQQKYWHISDIKVWNCNETSTNAVVSFEQPGPDLFPQIKLFIKSGKDKSSHNHFCKETA